MLDNRFETVDLKMTSAISLLHPIAFLNKQHDLLQVYMEPEIGSAIVGFRRQVANLGTVLVRAQYGKNNEIQLGNTYENTSGSYHYIQKEYFQHNSGLPGQIMDNGNPEAVYHDVAMKKIQDVKAANEMMYEAIFQPNMYYKVMNDYVKAHGETLENLKVNINFTTIAPKRTLIGKAVMDPATRRGCIRILGPDKQYRNFKIHANSMLPAGKLLEGALYYVKPAPPEAKGERNTVNVQGMHVPGTRVAVQGFKQGLIKPGDAGYSVTPNLRNGVNEKYILDFPFHPKQNIKKLVGAPMLTFDMDMFYELMKIFKGYPEVVMKFKDAESPVYFSARGDEEFRPHLEAIMGPTLQHVKGRIWLP